VIGLSQWFIRLCLWLLYQYHSEEWYVYHSDLSCYVSDYCISITKKSDRSITVIYHAMSLTTVSVSLRRVIGLSQWFIMLCLWLYCISITKKNGTFITVIYQAMSLTVLYQYHSEEWYVYHSDLSCYVSAYCISITKKNGTFITVIYQAMSLIVLYQYHSEEW
jgi:hypothetical protein